jgi:lysozyme family protein
MPTKKDPYSFESVFKGHTSGFEGGYVNDPADRGGETYRGISRKSWPDWAGWALIDQAKAAGLRSASAIGRHFADDSEMDALVTEFYKNEFWEPFDGGAA